MQPLPHSSGGCISLCPVSLRQMVFSETQKLRVMKRAWVLSLGSGLFVLSDFLESGCIIPLRLITQGQGPHRVSPRPFFVPRV
jgi:hypothetical protein